ncbi:hypothetical protein BCR34DRAFT_554242 [Clohesyomyces aquaticus]|uniref:Uncharacterized protein n=1 Tax=Clohesyomyces aquaticus TaxID=1231657 RepID=A0A1Y2A728_9PLEO|nr:hypothetical protein BCR34DRAFT_554242 [Clohesyomyces aquaticus]
MMSIYADSHPRMRAECEATVFCCCCAHRTKRSALTFTVGRVRCGRYEFGVEGLDCR